MTAIFFNFDPRSLKLVSKLWSWRWGADKMARSDSGVGRRTAQNVYFV